MIRLILSLAIALYAAPVLAQPSISSTSGTWADGNSITITGAAFGTGDATPLLWDNFEVGTTGAILNATPQIGTWVPDNRPSAVYSTTFARSGSKSSYAANTATSQWSNFTVALPVADRIYQSFWFRYVTGGTAGQLKLMQVHGPEPAIGDFAPGIMTGSSDITWWFSYITTESGTNDVETRVNYTTIPPQDVWHRYELIAKRSSAGNVADGEVTIKIDEAIQYQKINVITRENSANNWSETSFFHGVTNMAANTDIYLDDAYLNDCWCRVILADAATFAGITQSTIQVPTAWATGSISITAQKGGLGGYEGKYLYVVDATGSVNANGFAVSGVGDTGTGRLPHRVGPFRR